MKQLESALLELCGNPDADFSELSNVFYKEKFKPKEHLLLEGENADTLYFVNKGLLRMYVIDDQGKENTTLFGLEGSFMADYSAVLTSSKSFFNIQAIEETEVVSMPSQYVMQSYSSGLEGATIGRKIAEFYFLLFNKRIRAAYTKSFLSRYEELTQDFPNIHARVSQKMIASYLNISPVHLSRLKSQSYQGSKKANS